MATEIDPELFAYIRVLEGTITLAADELRPGGDPAYAGRVLRMMAERIKASMEAAEAEMEIEAARRHLH
jgi:hypothetical protein